MELEKYCKVSTLNTSFQMSTLYKKTLLILYSTNPICHQFIKLLVTFTSEAIYNN